MKKLLVLIAVFITTHISASTHFETNNTEFQAKNFNQKDKKTDEKTAQEYYNEADVLEKESAEHSKTGFIFLAIGLATFIGSRYFRKKNK